MIGRPYVPTAFNRTEIFQRLQRCLCDECKRLNDILEDILETEDNVVPKSVTELLCVD
jgi:hypothetical protein